MNDATKVITSEEQEKKAAAVRLKNIGLRGVTVADTKISHVDGENGILIYRGYRIEDLAQRSTFEEIAYLLHHDELPTEDELQKFRKSLVDSRPVPEFVFDALRKMPKESHPMDVLQAAIPILATADADLDDDSRGANMAKAIRLIARAPVIVAGWQRIREGKDLMPSDDALSHAANFLWQLTGRQPDPEIARDLDTILVLHADHSFNASTFACREVVSTQAHMYAGVAAGVGALSGSLHGGANALVMKMLQQLRNEKDIPAWVKNQLASGRKIMGMGHAVYKTVDPRASFLKDMCFRIGKKLREDDWCRLSTEIEETAIAEFKAQGKTTIKPNVDFYSATVYHLMGIPLDLMTPVFAVARIAGWTAHIIEEKFADAQEKPALYRPLSEYVGHYCGKTGCVYEPMENRNVAKGSGK
ncbi:MAG TPA: citrate/2-methylcitrate synthase [Spirochaetia bacterium]|nr:citrate/2-methylcitrate synthase [Spirochaetia bacterium]